VENIPQADELSLLLVLVKDYEDKHIKLPALDPIAVIKLKMKEKDIKARDLEHLIGSKGHVPSILSGRRNIRSSWLLNSENMFNCRLRFLWGRNCIICPFKVVFT